MPVSRILCVAIVASLSLLEGTMARAANYEFLAAPETDLNRVFRLDKITGEMGACQYALKDAAPAATATQPNAGPGDAAQNAKSSENTVGVTLCYPAGAGATPQTPGEYALVASHHDREGGVFRVDVRQGFMSICYVLNEAVVCTPPAK